MNWGALKQHVVRFSLIITQSLSSEDQESFREERNLIETSFRFVNDKVN